MMIYLLIILLLGLSILALAINRGDWFAPGVLVPLAFTACVLCATYNIDLWRIDLSLQTVLVVFAGVFLFMLFSLAFNRDKPAGEAATHDIQAIVLSNKCQILLLLFFILATTVYYRYLLTSFNALGVAGGSWNDMMYARRSASADVDLSSLTNMPTFVVYLYNTMHAIAFVVLFIVVNNVISEGRLNRRDGLLYCACFIYLASVVLRAGRLPIIEYAFAAMMLSWVIWHHKNGWKGRIRFSYAIGAIAIVAIVLVSFSSLRELVGRQNDADFVYYITSYAGGSIQLFDMYLKDPVVSSGLFGEETFRGIWSALARRLSFVDANSWQLEFRYVGGLCIGNVYTAFRYWIHDFGYAGAILVLFVYSAIYNGFYNKVTHRAKSGFDFALVLYAYLFSGLVMLPIQDVLFAMDLNPGSIYMMICIAFFGWLLIDRPNQSNANKRRIGQSLLDIKVLPGNRIATPQISDRQSVKTSQARGMSEPWVR